MIRDERGLDQRRVGELRGDDDERAADDISNIPRHELQILLRQAALLLRNFPGLSGEKWTPFRRHEEQSDDPGAV